MRALSSSFSRCLRRRNSRCATLFCCRRRSSSSISLLLALFDDDINEQRRRVVWCKGVRCSRAEFAAIAGSLLVTPTSIAGDGQLTVVLAGVEMYSSAKR